MNRCYPTLLLFLLAVSGTHLTLSGQSFTEAMTPLLGVQSGSVAFADVNGDNHQDVLITGGSNSFGRIAKLYINDGTGQFTEDTNAPFTGVGSSSISFADINGDSHPDVLITGETNSTNIAKLYTNNGSGQFTEVPNTPFTGVRRGSIAFADIDGDMDQDVLITGQDQNDNTVAKLYTNNGSGQFTEVNNTPFTAVYWSSVAFADVNGNSHQDVIITGRDQNNNQTAKLFTNNGSGQFAEVNNTPFLGVAFSAIAFADINGDTHPDVLISGGATNMGPQTKLYTNNGSGQFTEVNNTPFIDVSGGSIAFEDVNGDTHPDVLITGGDDAANFLAKLYINNGSGQFTEVLNTPFSGVSGSSIAFADVNGGAQPDVLITGADESFDYIAKLYINDAPGIADYDNCTSAADINNLFGQTQDVPQTSGIFNNVDATTDASDPDFGWECFGEPDGLGGAPSLERTLWFSFIGDGSNYYITTVQCNSTDFIDFGDTQLVIYSGASCDALSAEACSEDGPDAQAGGPFPAGLEFQTQTGVQYHMMIDGFGPDFPADGEFCIQVTNLGAPVVNVTFQIDATALVQNGDLSPQGMFLAGEFNGWPDPGDLMTEGSNNIWSTTLQLQAGTYEYKFQNGPGGWEQIDLSIGDNCTIGNNNNRIIVVENTTITTDPVCFNYCVTCDMAVDIAEVSASTGISIFPNPTTGELFLEGLEVKQVEIFSTTGQLMQRAAQPGNRLDVSDLPTGIYMLRIKTEEGLYSARVAKQ